MINYKKILENKEVITKYGNIDKINPYSFSHGLKHVKNVCMIMNDLCDVLNIDDDMRESLLFTSALHDIGQEQGRENHGLKAKNYVIDAFNEEIKDSKYYSDILESLEKHDNIELDPNESLFLKLVQFADKMDFSKNRLEDNYRDRFKYYIFEEIEKINFIYDDKYFKIDIITSNIENFYIKLLHEGFSEKIINNLISLSKKLERTPKLLVNGIEQDITVKHLNSTKTLYSNNINDNMIKYLKDNIDNRYSIIFLDSKEEPIKDILSCFKKCNITLKNILVINATTTKEEYNEFIKNNKKIVYFLMNGNPYNDLNIINKLDLTKDIREHNDVVIGFGKGIITLSKYAIIIDKDKVTDIIPGIGRENISVIPYTKINEELDTISKKYQTKIYPLKDNSIIYFEYGNLLEK